LARRLLVVAALLGGITCGFHEARTSALQSQVAAALARRATHPVRPGPSPSIRFPSAGPYDVRHGYTRLPDFTSRLVDQGFEIESQARFSPVLMALTAVGLPPVWREPASSALRLEDRRGEPLFDARRPPGYADFDAIPALVADALVYVENRELLRDVHPYRNPVLEWDRLARAGLQFAREQVGLGAATAGGSTLAIQIEKFRHSPGGITDSPLEKLRQIAAATLRAYREGRSTRGVRRELVVDYLNSLPLAAVPGHGEVLGLREGLEAWYGADFERSNERLRRTPRAGPVPPEEARSYAEALSLILATQRPTAYLLEDPGALAARMSSYLALMEQDGVISRSLREAAARAPLARRGAVPPSPDRAIERKPAAPIRTRLVEMLGLSGYPELDLLDLRVESTLDRRAQLRATERLRALRDPRRAAALGLTGYRLLGPGEAQDVVYSFSLYERGVGVNRLLVQTDNFPSALDVSEGAKLDLGSTAKLRTLVSYLEALTALHEELAKRDREELRALPVHPKDRLTGWALGLLIERPGMSLPEFLDAGLARRYSASPGEAFFTGGGLHRFANFDRRDDARIVSVREAFRDSINLPFVRLMRDLVDHLIFRTPGGGRSVLENLGDPRRESYLTRFADRESRIFLRRFHARYGALSGEEALARLLAGRTRTAKRVAVVLRSLEPAASYEAFAAEMQRLLGARCPAESTLRVLHQAYGPDRLGLSDRGYLAGLHPLELWLVAFLRSHPEAGFEEIVTASEAERVEVYRWLFRSRHKSAQDRRIRGELEREAFEDIHRQWREMGYPFESLVPSYATAIGSSADRPAALAELVGILLNDGVRQPTRRIERLGFGEGTPYETRFVPAPRAGRRVVATEVAAAVRGALRDVVAAGTARRADGALLGPDGVPLPIAGKTGTGDHRYKVFAPGGRLVESHVVSRTATFVFTLDERFYGVITAHVSGPAAAGYGFTSSLPVQVFRVLVPEIVGPLLGEPLEASRGDREPAWSGVPPQASMLFSLPFAPAPVVKRHS
jgi:membrane peptidoglycan carboxypeptidase